MIGKLHYYLVKPKKGDFLVNLAELLKAGVSTIRIHPLKSGFKKNEVIQIVKYCNKKASLFIDDDLDFALAVNANGLFITETNCSLTEIKAKYPNLLIGGNAHNLADSKNWELQNVDFIQLNSIILSNKKQNTPTPMGSELFQAVIPKEEEYGWMIMSINSPIIIAGVNTFKALKDILKYSTVQGITINDNFEPNTNRVTCIEQILGIIG